MENIEFPQALEMAAKKAGIKLENSSFSNDKQYSEKKALYKANRDAANFFNYILTKHERGKIGLNYAQKKRALNIETINKYLIGFAPSGYENLKNYMIKKGYNAKDLIKWSLLVEKSGRIYDKFRNRLMFPIQNHVGDIIGFSGRVINKEDLPKYLNSSETAVYKKSDILYGLFQARDSIRKNHFVIIVEGNIDVPMAWQTKIENVVAPMGTALTSNQLKLLKRYTSTVYFCFDSDIAGEKALIRSFELAENEGFGIKVIDLEGYTDMDEYIRNKGNLVKKQIDSAEPLIDHLIIRLSKRLDLSKAESKRIFIDSLLPYLHIVKDKIKLMHYIQKLASVLSIEEKLIIAELNQYSPNTVTTDKKVDLKTIKTVAPQNTLRYNKEKIIISFLIQFEELQSEKFDEKIFKHELLLKIFNTLKGKNDIKKIISTLNPEDQEIASSLIMENLGEYKSVEEARHFFKEALNDLQMVANKEQISEIKQLIKKGEETNEDVSPLLIKLKELSKKSK